MKRKEYISRAERIADRKIGATVFCIGNLLIFGIYKWAQYQLTSNASTFQPGELARYLRYVELLPWLANGALLLASAIFWKEVAVGYIGCFGIIIAALFALGGLFLTSCVLASSVYMLIGQVAVAIGVGLFIWGLIYVIKIITDLIGRIWDY